MDKLQQTLLYLGGLGNLLGVTVARLGITRQVIFKHYGWIAVVFWIASVGAVFEFTTADKVTLIGSITVVALGFCYFAQQQKLAETSLFKDLFTDFNQRYDGLNDCLAKIGVSDGQLEPADRQTIVNYFNLCAEEYLFFSEGYIHPAAWRSWCTGMLWYFNREPFRSVWRQESETDSYYGLSLYVIQQGAA